LKRINDSTADGLTRIPDLSASAELDIQELRDCVLPGEPPALWKYRLAPSIVARSEAGLFSLSTPRFACRVYLDDKGAFFVNVRRIMALCQGAKWGKREVPTERRETRFKEDPQPPSMPSVVFSESPCIGDCFLPVNQDWYRGYHVIQAELGRLYGEVPDPQHPASGIPYVMHMKLGGGWCAQATCFMAAMLMHEHATHIHGVAEITAIARQSPTDPKPIKELPLGGLSEGEMAAYFTGIGLTPSCQYLSVLRRLASQDEERTNNPALLEQAAWPYIRSGIPLVIYTDVGRMNGHKAPEPKIGLKTTCLYEENKLPWRKRRGRAGAVIRPQRHAVLLIGYNPREKKFLFNDARAFPLMHGTARQIVDARTYEDRDCTKLRDASFMAVTPGPVKLPLQNSYVPPNDEVRGIGLLQMAEMLQAHGCPGLEDLPRVEGGARPGELRLLPWDEIAGCDFDVNAHIGSAVLDKIAGEVGIPEDRWCWAQYVHKMSPNGDSVPHSLWVWDACLSPPGSWAKAQPYHAVQYLVCVLQYKDEAWTPSFYQTGSWEPQQAGSRPSPTRPDPGEVPKASLISSFAVKDGLRGAATFWPEEEAPGEVYGFMSSDGHWLEKFSNLPGSGPATAVEHLAAIWNRDESARETATRDVAIHLGYILPGVRFLGFATFMPEILTDDPKIAQNALQCLVDVAVEARKLSHPAHMIEIVGGGLIRGVWPAVDTEAEDESWPKAYIANCWTDDGQALSRLCENLRPVAEYADRKGVFLSLELEPGPLFAVRDEKTLGLLLDALEERGAAACRAIGLNLDMAHYALSGLDPVALAGDPEFLRRVVHCHASGHAKGHLGDIPFENVHTPEEIYRWLHVAVQAHRWHRTEKSKKFSGHVSVELECSGDDVSVKTTFGHLNMLLGHAAKGGAAPQRW
jgi:hypothetical protein